MITKRKDTMATFNEKLNKLSDVDLEKVTGGAGYVVVDSNGNIIGYADTLQEAIRIMDILKYDPSYSWKGRKVAY